MDRLLPISLQEPLSTAFPTLNGGIPKTRDVLGEDISHAEGSKGAYEEPQIEVFDNNKTFLYYFFIVLYLSVAIVSLLLNSHLLRALLKQWGHVEMRPFFIFLIVLCFVNVVSGLCNAVCNFPIVTFFSSLSPDNLTSEIADYTFTNKDHSLFRITEHLPAFYKVFYNVELVEEQMIQWLTFWIAVLRFVTVVIPPFEKILFHRLGLAVQITFSITVSSVQVAFMKLWSCYFRYSRLVGYFIFGCYDLNSIDAWAVIYGYKFTRIFLPIIAFVLYLAVFARVMCIRRHYRTYKVERTVLFQSFAIFIAFELAGLLTINLMTQAPLPNELVFNTRRILDTADTLAAAVAPALVLVAGLEHDVNRKDKLFHRVIRKVFRALPKSVQNKVLPS